MDETKIVFSTHIDHNGCIVEGKEKFYCVFCRGEAYVSEDYVTPMGDQHFTYKCTDCDETWKEIY